jgi:hypothetical protein
MTEKRDAAEEIARAAMAAFEPLARLFLELGMSSPDAETLLRNVFVNETKRWIAARDGEEAVSLSRVSLLSGVHRNTVSEILSSKEIPTASHARGEWSQRAERVLREWHFDQAYLKADGTPRVLKVRSEKESEPTFWTLCSSYAPSIWPATILEELLLVKAVRKNKRGTVEVLKASYGGPNAKTDAIREMGTRARDLLQTLVHNLTAAYEDQRVVETMENISVNPEFARLLRRMFRQRAQAITASVEAELNSQSARAEGPSAAKRVRMGMTVFAFESPAPEEALPRLTEKAGKNSGRKRKTEQS